MTNNKIIICYIDKNNQQRFIETDYALNLWKSANPECTIKFAFYKTNDLTSTTEVMEFQFKSLCKKYGFISTDLHKKYISPSGHIQEIMGLIEQNKKYKIAIYDHTEKSDKKATPEYVLTRLTNNPYPENKP